MGEKQKLSTGILILGAGLGGFEALRSLQKQLKKNNVNKEITVIDRNNYFTFTPLLHEIATGSVNPNHATIPIRELTHKTPHKFIKSKVKNIKPEEKIVETNKNTIEYEKCIISLGSSINFCSIEGAKMHTHHVRTLSDALKLKNSIINNLEKRLGSLSINIVGGGYTGVEIAAELGQMKNHEFKKLFPETKVNINLIEVQNTILNQMSKKVQDKVLARLKKLGVNVNLNTSVKKVTKKKILLSDNEEFKNEITVWAAGFRAHANKHLPENYSEKGRIPVNSHLQHRKDKSIYAIGDMAYITDPETNEPYPQLGEASYQEGVYVAKQILADLKNKDTKSFTFKSRGRLMPVGEWYGVAVIGWLNNFTFFGCFAWWLRRTSFILFMPSWVRKVKLAFEWTMQTFSFRDLTEVCEINCEQKEKK